MNTRHSNYGNESLQTLLHAWKVSQPLPPEFRERVWRGIARDTSRRELVSPWTALTRWFAQWQLRPAAAATLLAGLLVIGAAAGWTQALSQRVQTNAELGNRYARLVNPYQAVP